MTSQKERDMFFWAGCMPARTGLVYVAANAEGDAKKVLRAGAAVVAANWLLGMQDSEIGFFGGEAWWADLRKAHGLVWALYSATGDWRFLAADTAGGALAWFFK